MALPTMRLSMKAEECIHIVDRDSATQRALSRILDHPGWAIRQYHSAREFLLAQQGDATGCLIVELELPGESGLDLQAALGKTGHVLSVIFLTAQGDIESCVRAMKAGAIDYLTKPVQREKLLSAVRTALARNRRDRAVLQELAHFRSRFESLTPRQKEIFVRVAAGKLNKQIALEIGTAERTVKAHRAHMMERLGITSVAELVHMADLLDFAFSSAAAVQNTDAPKGNLPIHPDRPS
jgi:FixJ family two-component response regulator